MSDIVKLCQRLNFEVNDFSIEILLFVIIDEFDLVEILRIIARVVFIILMLVAIINYVNSFVGRYLPSAQKRLSYRRFYLN